MSEAKCLEKYFGVRVAKPVGNVQLWPGTWEVFDKGYKREKVLWKVMTNAESAGNARYPRFGANCVESPDPDRPVALKVDMIDIATKRQCP